MSDEAIYKYAGSHLAISGTATLASAGFCGSAEVTSMSSTQTAFYPMADAALFASFSTSVSSLSNIVVMYRRDHDIDSTNDAPQPQSAAPAYSATQVGHFIIPPYTATSSGFFACPVDVPLSQNCAFYIENKTNASIVAGFTLKITPKTFAPAA